LKIFQSTAAFLAGAGLAAALLAGSAASAATTGRSLAHRCQIARKAATAAA